MIYQPRTGLRQFASVLKLSLFASVPNTVGMVCLAVLRSPTARGERRALSHSGTGGDMSCGYLFDLSISSRMAM